MAFIVEDGTGVADANAYIDAPYMRDYFETRGVTFTESDTVLQTWIVQGTDYIESVFGWRLIGDKKYREQGLHFPAVQAYTREGELLEDDVIPGSLMRACAEYARRAKAGPLMPDPLVDKSGFAVVNTRKKVGPIEKEFQVMGSAGAPLLVRSYPAADGLLFTLLRVGSGGGTRVIR